MSFLPLPQEAKQKNTFKNIIEDMLMLNDKDHLEALIEYRASTARHALSPKTDAIIHGLLFYHVINRQSRSGQQREHQGEKSMPKITSVVITWDNGDKKTVENAGKTGLSEKEIKRARAALNEHDTPQPFEG